jgi:divalent metal cation (Fe/Co/Zn/Cd) transporter
MFLSITWNTKLLTIKGKAMGATSKWHRKDFLLIIGILFFLIGLIGVGLTPIYAIIISLTIYFGIRIFVGRRKKMIEESVGEGICVKCGSKIENKKCPICDRKKFQNG